MRRPSPGFNHRPLCDQRAAEQIFGFSRNHSESQMANDRSQFPREKQGKPKQVAALGKSTGKPGEPIILWTISPTESQRCVWTCGATDGASVGAITSHHCC